MVELDFYRTQSTLTDPGDYAHLFDDLPHDLPGLIKVVQRLIVHLNWAHSYNLRIPKVRRKEVYLRTVPEMLGCILELDPSPLTALRSPEKRKVGVCRDYAVMLVSMLRHQGIPARLRIGFGGYFRSVIPNYWDHRITEYWDGGRWVLVDPQIDAVQRKALRLRIDPLNITTDSPFLMAGDVWQRCQAGQANPLEFGDSPTDRGIAPIRYALLHDFDALNKVELVGFDAWHSLIDKPEHEITQDERALLDKIAALTTHVDTQFDTLQTLYQTTSYGQTVLARLLNIKEREILQV